MSRASTTGLLDRASTEKGSLSTFTRRARTWLKQQIDSDQHYLEAELILLAIATGIIDACSFPKYHCFVSNQTGNTVLFAVAAFSLFGDRSETNFQVPVSHLGLSLGFFILGVFSAGQTANFFDSKFSRWWLLLTNTVGTTATMIAALLALLYNRDYEDQNSVPPLLIEIALLAFSAGAQVAMSRQLSMPEIPTTQATAAYVDLFVDPNFFAGVTKNRSRNRRIFFLIALVIGSFIGAPAYHYVSSALTIFLAGMLKVMVTLMMFFNATKERR